MRYFLALALASGMLNCAIAQEAVVRRDANLRVDPSSNEPPEAKLHPGDRLTLLDATPEHGYYQVKTQDGKDGWVFSKSIRVIASPSPSQPAADPEDLSTAGHAQCDDTLWTHVYHAHRLVVKQPCIAVTGTIVDATNGKKPDGVRHEADGDTHGWLRLDPGLEDLLNPGNLNNEGGNLVFEIVCKFSVTQTDAVQACSDYKSPVAIPPVGSHVQIVGTYVRDTNHAQWMEIHPVTSITVIP
jgi:Bacterial SH3 domain